MIKIYRDVLSEELIQSLFEWNEKTKGGDVWASNQAKWLDVLKYATTGTILSRVLPDNFRNDIISNLYSRGKIDWMPTTTSALFYMGFPNSCVNWHPDFPDYDAMSIYLNKDWDSNWGGWFAYTEEYNWVDGDVRPGHGKFVVPKYNMSIMSTEKEWHCTTPISPFAHPRLSIQLFFSKKT